MPPQPDQPRTYRRRHRLSRDADYRAVYNARIRKAHGPLLVFIKPNDLPEHRLGLAVGRRVGNAVARGRIKRLLREAFRLERAALPTPLTERAAPNAFDIIVSVRAHTPMPLARYREILRELVTRAAREHAKRAERAPAPPDTP
jgi:ribonuclease P protein component